MQRATLCRACSPLRGTRRLPLTGRASQSVSLSQPSSRPADAVRAAFPCGGSLLVTVTCRVR